MAEHNTPSTQARDELGIELRSFYRTSPPAADRWVHRARYEVCFFGVLCCGPGGRPSPSFGPSAGPRRWPAPDSAEPTSGPRREKDPPDAIDALRKTQAKRGDKAKQALAPALKFKAVDEKAFDKLARNVERLAAGSVATTEFVARVLFWCACSRLLDPRRPAVHNERYTPRRHRRDHHTSYAIAATRHRRRWARAEGGGAAAPLAVVAELASPPAGEDEYGHEVVDVANGAAAAAFLAAGHGVIDVAAMLGLHGLHLMWKAFCHALVRDLWESEGSGDAGLFRAGSGVELARAYTPVPIMRALGIQSLAVCDRFRSGRIWGGSGGGPRQLPRPQNTPAGSFVGNGRC